MRAYAHTHLSLCFQKRWSRWPIFCKLLFSLYIFVLSGWDVPNLEVGQLPIFTLKTIKKRASPKTEPSMDQLSFLVSHRRILCSVLQAPINVGAGNLGLFLRGRF